MYIKSVHRVPLSDTQTASRPSESLEYTGTMLNPFNNSLHDSLCLLSTVYTAMKSIHLRNEITRDSEMR